MRITRLLPFLVLALGAIALTGCNSDAANSTENATSTNATSAGSPGNTPAPAAPAATN